MNIPMEDLEIVCRIIWRGPLEVALDDHFCSRAWLDAAGKFSALSLLFLDAPGCANAYALTTWLRESAYAMARHADAQKEAA